MHIVHHQIARFQVRKQVQLPPWGHGLALAGKPVYFVLAQKYTLSGVSSNPMSAAAVGTCSAGQQNPPVLYQRHRVVLSDNSAASRSARSVLPQKGIRATRLSAPLSPPKRSSFRLYATADFIGADVPQCAGRAAHCAKIRRCIVRRQAMISSSGRYSAFWSATASPLPTRSISRCSKSSRRSSSSERMCL